MVSVGALYTIPQWVRHMFHAVQALGLFRVTLPICHPSFIIMSALMLAMLQARLTAMKWNLLLHKTEAVVAIPTNMLTSACRAAFCGPSAILGQTLLRNMVIILLGARRNLKMFIVGVRTSIAGAVLQHSLSIAMIPAMVTTALPTT